MSGTSAMLPICFRGGVKLKKEQIHKSEKSVEIIKQLISYITKMGELILDQLAGSCAIATACFETNRLSISIEKDNETFSKAVERMQASQIPFIVLEYA